MAKADEKVSVTFNVDRDMRKAITAGAKANFRTVSSYVTAAVADALFRDGVTQSSKNWAHVDE
jgi:hypothetical protein